MNHPDVKRKWTLVLVGLAGLLLAALVAPALAQRRDKAAEDKAKADKAAEAKYRADLAAGKIAASQPTTSEDEMTARLLAARDKAKGALFPGNDPAFLVLPRPAERGTMAYDLLTPKVREMTEKALGYMAGKQEADGGFSDTQFSSNTGVTAFALLAFMSEGSRPRVGKYGKVVDRGMEFLLKNVQTSGVIAGKGSNPLGPGYENAFSTLALLYAYGDMPTHPEVRDVIARSIQAIARSQKLDGGWRYDFSREGHSDMSVTANVLWVLRTAKKAGFTVSADAVAKGVSYVEKCAMPDGTFRYRTFGIYAEPSLGGTGVIALCNNGSLSHPLVNPARDRIAYDYNRYSIEDLKARRYFVFGAFYASLAMYMCGDYYDTTPGKQRGFVPWFQKASQVLAAMQRKDGEFWDEYDNTVYTTAMSLIVLQSPLGYLPIFER
ncbi:MAG: prenyltransferase/squalene oxidase repeat-containing protein [Phycisphaerae bacterium]|nr:prenyltransferase/squalene oxidase repeat-containing protein [Phycisphaerae bacterium]